MNGVYTFAEITKSLENQVGGKGWGLAEMAQAGLPVPPGFVISTDIYQQMRESGRISSEVASVILAAYGELGEGKVAVRSSAVDEDGTAASFAGQQETYLGIEGDEPLLKAIERCWQSLNTARAQAYRRRQGLTSESTMAVVVQKLVPAEVAGVMFTQDPTSTTHRLLIEASWGLGEAVVSGKVTPDRFWLDGTSGSIIEKQIGQKHLQILDGTEQSLSQEQQSRLCLNDKQLSSLFSLGKQVETFYGSPRDIEWAIAGDTVYLLQARPITTISLDREKVRQDLIRQMRTLAESQDTVWVRHNLSEILHEPTPMTWAVVRRLVAADGGFGALNRDLGCKPDVTLGSLGAFDLVAGRPMANLARMPRMQFARPPFVYPLARIREQPTLAFEARPELKPLARGWLGLPGVIRDIWQMSAATRRAMTTFESDFRLNIVPKLDQDARTARNQDWTTLTNENLYAIFNDWIQRTLVDFARHSLKATVFADQAWSQMVEMFKPFAADKAAGRVAELAKGTPLDPEIDFTRGLADLAAGRLSRGEFVARFGHRGAHEMELSAPRWSEQPEELDRIVRSLPTTDRHAEGANLGQTLIKSMENPFDESNKKALRLAAEQLWKYLALREFGKHYLLLGYAVIRAALVELDRRFQLQNGIFFLLPHELPELISGTDMRARIQERRLRQRIELSLPVPPVLFSQDLEAIGRPLPVPENAESFKGVGVSAGTDMGPALVLLDPETADAGPDGFVLVCPSTDPSWVPLFAKAKAIVLETGGVLSHGAIVAREFGIPAVAGLPGITGILRNGERISVDGNAGIVTRIPVDVQTR